MASPCFDNLSGEEWTEVKQKYEIVKISKVVPQKTIVKAKCKEDGSLVTIKKVSRPTESFEKARQLLREIQILKHLQARCGSLDYAPFAKLYDVLYHEGDGGEGLNLTVFIITELGHLTLKELLCQAGIYSLGESHVRKILYQLLTALRLLHEAGIVHRDIRPSNILLDRDLNVKLSNFGASRTLQEPQFSDIGQKTKNNISFSLQDSQHVRRHLPRRLSVVRSDRTYCAPELLLNEKQYDTGIDMWGLGCTLAEMLACTLQYRAIGADVRRRFLFKMSKFTPSGDDDPEWQKDQAQLKKLLQTMGEQSRSDLSFITCEEAKFQIDKMVPKSHSIDFNEEFSLSDQSLVKPLKTLLEFNYHFREPAAAILSGRAFDPVRDIGLDSLSLGDSTLKVDHPRVYDYEAKVGDVLDTSDLEKYIKKELAS